MARLQQHYKEKVVADLTAKFGYKSVMEVPRLTKITLNMGLSEAVADKKIIEHAVGDVWSPSVVHACMNFWIAS
jgi:large subunit ribosomal protein L5